MTLWWKEGPLGSDIWLFWLLGSGYSEEGCAYCPGRAWPLRAQGLVTHPGLCRPSPITTRGDEGEKGTGLSLKADNGMLKDDRKIVDFLILSLSQLCQQEEFLSHWKVWTNPPKRELRRGGRWRTALLPSAYSMYLFLIYPVRQKPRMLTEYLKKQ